jgi:hypothetical protein
MVSMADKERGFFFEFHLELNDRAFCCHDADCRAVGSLNVFELFGKPERSMR